MRLLVSTSTGGQGSQFANSARVGEVTTIELPLGRYGLTPPGKRRVFVATGTGLAPLLPMFRTLADAGELDQATLLFGCRGAETDLTRQLDDPLPGQLLRCYSREDSAEARRGRVTDALAQFDFAPAETEFYLCGSGAMVADCQALLASRGAEHLFTEPY